MLQDLGFARLSTGETIRLVVVQAPDRAWAPRLMALLGHKPPVYLGHVHAALEGALDELETRFYLGLVDDAPVTVAMVAGAGGAGVFGHVFTVPAWRRRGASGALHRVMQEDVRACGYRCLTLGTNPDGHARRLYEGIGFRQVLPGSGTMVWGDPSAPEGPSGVGPARWADWGWVSVAGCAPIGPGEALPRSALLHVGHQPEHIEAPYIRAMRDARALSILRRGGAAVGWAELSADAAAILGATALDLYVRPECATPAAATELLNALAWPAGRAVVCPAGGEGYRAEALAAAGFRPSARLPELAGLALWVRPPM